MIDHFPVGPCRACRASESTSKDAYLVVEPIAENLGWGAKTFDPMVVLKIYMADGRLSVTLDEATAMAACAQISAGIDRAKALAEAKSADKKR